MNGEIIIKKRFPLFIDLTNWRILVIGGGNIATRRVAVLLEFADNITVISPEITPELKRLSDMRKINLINRKYKNGDLECDLIITATNDREVNREVADCADRLGIICSVADARDEGSLWFPAIINENGLIAGVISEDGNHKKVKESKQKIKNVLSFNKSAMWLN